MAAQQTPVRAADNSSQNISTVQDASNSNALMGVTTIADPTAGTKAPVNASGLQVTGAVAAGATAAGNPVPAGAVFNTTPATLTNGQAAALQTDNVQNLLTKVNVALPAGTNVIGKTGIDQTTPGTTNAVAAAGMGAAGSAPVGNPVLVAGSDGTNAQNLATDPNGALRHAPGKSAWSATNTSAAAAQATCNSAAGAAGVKNVCTSIFAQLVGDGTGNADQATINLRDGATGAGTVIASFKVALATGANAVGTPFAMTGEWVGSAATAMTLEMSAAGATHTIGIVNMTGYQTK